MIKTDDFLKDILICSLGAYGGPSAHYGVFTDQLVTKKNYLSEEELVELIALCSILPGPTSTQTIVSIGYKMGGPRLAFLTMMVWALPVIIMMIVLSFMYGILQDMNLAEEGLRFIGPMAVGFIVVAAFRIGKKVLTNRMTWILLIASAVITYFIRDPWIYPLVLIIGGIVSILVSKEKDLWHHMTLRPPWPYLIAFAFFAVISLAAATLWHHRLIQIFEHFYRYGYLVFGGGQVVIPVMYSELITQGKFMSHEAFLTGYGLVQGLPGPMFSFSAFAGAMAASDGRIPYQIIGGILGSIGIFLPGLLLIYFVYPIWHQLRAQKGIKIALIGINAVSGGLIAIAGVILMQKSGMTLPNVLMMLATVILLATKKIPAPIIVLIALALGFLV